MLRLFVVAPGPQRPDALEGEPLGHPDPVPAPAQAALKQVNGVEQKMGPKALREVRDKTFHYPRPDRGYSPDSSEQLGGILEAFADEPVEMHQPDKQIRFTFADTVALALAFGKHYPPSDPRFRAQQEEALKGATSFSNLTKFIVFAYLRENGVELEETDATLEGPP